MSGIIADAGVGLRQSQSFELRQRLYGSQSYTYEGVGNRLTRVVGSTTDTYAYSPTANQISTITTGSNVRSFSYLASGQVSQDVRDASNTYTFAANDNIGNASASLKDLPS